MPGDLKFSVLGVLAAICVTTLTDASGLTAFRALPLFPLLVPFCLVRTGSRHPGTRAEPAVSLSTLALDSPKHAKLRA